MIFNMFEYFYVYKLENVPPIKKLIFCEHFKYTISIIERNSCIKFRCKKISWHLNMSTQNRFVFLRLKKETFQPIEKIFVFSNVHMWLNIHPTEHSKHFWLSYFFKSTLPRLYGTERNSYIKFRCICKWFWNTLVFWVI